MSFTYDTKGSNTLTGDARSAAGSFSSNNKSQQGVTWGSDFNTWAAESRQWGQVASQLTQDTKH